MPFKRRSKNLNKSTLISLQVGERSCACIASYKCGEGVHPVRETISREFAPNPLLDSIAHLGGGVKYAWRKASRGKYIGLLSTPTSLKDDCKKGKCNELGGQPSCHCEGCAARRGNPVEQRLNLLDCFTTFAMTTTVTNYSTLQPFNYSTNTPSLESEVPCLA